MRSVTYRVSLVLAIIVCSPMGYAFAESSPAVEDCSILPANNVWNSGTDPLPIDPNASTYTSAIRTSAGVHPDSGTVKPTNPSPESSPSPGGPRASFWQWLSSRTVDCSSGACTFK